jgi:N-carbamoyl-L-amino-acid hydrolase
MDRRRFGRHFIGALGGVLSAPPLLRAMSPRRRPQGVRVNGPRLLETFRTLSTFGATPEGGVHRVAFSDADLAGRAYVRELLVSAGFAVSVDPAGNLVGRKAGREAGLPVLMTGSHIDSVPQGGRFDGNVGVVGAVEAVRALHDQGYVTRHSIEVVVFANEEGGKTGSRAMSGEVTPDEWDLPTASGHTIGEGTRIIGGDPARLTEAKREPGSVHAYLELHIEQGAVLDEAGTQIGVVEGIVGIRRWNVTAEGFANHAGTTPMDKRRDALLATARFIDAANRIARETEGRQVATVGRIRAEPGAPNVIPGRVVSSLEIRDLEMEKIDRVFEGVRAEAERIERSAGATFDFEPFYVSRAAPTDPRLRAVVEDAARELGYSTLRMPSGAGHDAQSIALVAPIGIIFVPSREGISHSPREFTDAEDLVAGANVLLSALLDVDRIDL